MLNNPILYRVLTHPLLYQCVLAIIFPLLLWAVLVRLSRGYPGILHFVFPWLRILVWGLWASFAAWGLCGIFGIPERKTFYGIHAVLSALVGGTNLMYHWVGRRVDPEAYVKAPNEGWWPSKPEV